MDPYGPMEWNRGVLIKKLNYCGSGVEARVALQQYYHPWGIPLVAYTVIPLWAAAHFYLSVCLCASVGLSVGDHRSHQQSIGDHRSHQQSIWVKEIELYGKLKKKFGATQKSR